MFSSDLGHWDVPDMARDPRSRPTSSWRTASSTEADFRDFVFGNPVRFYTAANPDFFRGTRVEAAAARLVAAERGARGRGAREAPSQGRVALVTGASRGIGKGCALELGAAGATVYVTGRTHGGGRRAAAGHDRRRPPPRSTAAGGRGIAVRCDHRDDEARGGALRARARASRAASTCS